MGTVVDASIPEAPSSTKNRSGERNRETPQPEKGNLSCFGMKAHIGGDADTGILHGLSTTGDNVQDVTEPHSRMHGGWDGGVVRCRVSGSLQTEG